MTGYLFYDPDYDNIYVAVSSVGVDLYLLSDGMEYVGVVDAKNKTAMFFADVKVGILNLVGQV